MGAFEQRVRHALTNPIRVPPFDVTFDGLGMFPERGSPRVLWLGVAEGLEPWRRLHAASAGLDAFVGPEKSFTPHLTLARFRDRVNRSTLAGISEFQPSPDLHESIV